MLSTCWSIVCGLRSIPKKRVSTPCAELAMSSAPEPARRSAGFRLNVWYTVLFASSTGALFALAYVILARLVERTDRTVLESKLGEYAAIYQGGGFPALEQA